MLRENREIFHCTIKLYARIWQQCYISTNTTLWRVKLDGALPPIHFERRQTKINFRIENYITVLVHFS